MPAATSGISGRSGATRARAWSAVVAAHREPPDIEPAETHYRQAVVLAEELGMRPLVAHCHLGLGKLYVRTGQREQAQKHLATAAVMYRDMDMTYWLEKAEQEVKELL